MKRTTSRIALAAAIAALAAPALASARDATAVDGDPTFPALESPAPAFALSGSEATSLRADPTFPATDRLAPAARLSEEPADALQLPSWEGWEPAHVALEVAPAAADRVAKAK